jgi:ubiquinone/menaquinone biosynthesis C-methylase UbiE
MQSFTWTGERLVSAIEDETATEHLHRYGFAMNYCIGKAVVDIACGEGYGSALLSKVAASVIGIDIDRDVVNHATQKYKRSNLSYLQGSADTIPLADASADVVVSYETIEHHDKHTEMLSEIKRILKPGGLLIISTPDKKYYTDERNFKNAFHIKELTKQEFCDLLNKYFRNNQLFYQKICYGSVIVPEQKTEVTFELLSGNYESINDFDLKPLYNIAVCSDAELPKPAAGFFNGESNMNNRVNAVYDSASYRLGYTLLGPLRFFKTILGIKNK